MSDKPIATIDDFIETLSPAERELHKELIAECRIRELNLIESSKRSNELAGKYKQTMRSFYQKLVGLQKQAHSTLDKISDASLALNNHLFNEYCRKKEQGE